MTPYMAQGAAMAIEDAAVLSRCLDGVERDGVAECVPTIRGDAARKNRRGSSERREPIPGSRKRPDTDWVYAYDAWTAPLAG